MKKFGLATIAATGFAAVLVGMAAPASAVTAVASPTYAPSAFQAPAGVDHLDWLSDIQPKANAPKVDTSVRHSGGAR